MKRPLVFLLLALFPGLSLCAEPARIAFLGDSITYDGRWPVGVEAELRSRPEYAEAEIVNFGLPSETLSGLSEPNHADGKFPRPCLFERLDRVLNAYRPTLVIASYGMNDGIYLPADPQRKKAFTDGAEKLQEKVKNAGARLIWVTPPLFEPDHPESDAQHYDAVLDSFAKDLVAHRKRGWEVIDIRPGLSRAVAAAKKKDAAFIYAADNVHPGDEGHRLIAAEVIPALDALLKLPDKPQPADPAALAKLSERAALLKHAWLTKTGYQRPGLPTGIPLEQAQAQAADLMTDYQALVSVKHSGWEGFDRIDFISTGREALLVSPKNPAPGNPWIWRTEFFGHEPQGDIALLNKGFHVAYVDVHGLWGSPTALDGMEHYYGVLTRTYHLSPKPVLEGFSRGGLFAFNWAARHPDWTGALYVDAPLCDFKSAPYGIKAGAKSPNDWQELLGAWKFTEAEALAYDKNPVDNLAPLAAAHIPILSVVGDADEIVPVDENTGLVETRYKAQGGEIQVIHKPGGKHHPHSLPDPAPIVDFVLKATGVSQ